MNLGELQAELRHFAAERDWQSFHTPKNLAMALVVEAAELAENFQWMTPEESVALQEDAEARARVGAEVADVLLYLLQVADHCQIDLAGATRDKLAKNALKYPAKREIARVSPTRALVPGTHILLDYENVQPTEAELRVLVPEVSQVWVFHGPQQRDIEQRFASFGTSVTPVPISKTGKNALDFHLSFYMGYIASRNPESTIVVVANDKGYEPMLEHARAMGFLVRRQTHGAAPPTAKQTPAKKAVAKKAAAKKAPAKKPAAKPVATKKAAAKKAPPPAPKKTPASKVAAAKKVAPAKKVVSTKPVLKTTSSIDIDKITANLRKLGTSRPTKPAALRRLLKSLLGAAAADASIEAMLSQLIASGTVVIGGGNEVKYPTFESAP